MQYLFVFLSVLIFCFVHRGLSNGWWYSTDKTWLHAHARSSFHHINKFLPSADINDKLIDETCPGLPLLFDFRVSPRSGRTNAECENIRVITCCRWTHETQITITTSCRCRPSWEAWDVTWHHRLSWPKLVEMTSGLPVNRNGTQFRTVSFFLPSRPESTWFWFSSSGRFPRYPRVLLFLLLFFFLRPVDSLTLNQSSSSRLVSLERQDRDKLLSVGRRL